MQVSVVQSDEGTVADTSVVKANNNVFRKNMIVTFAYEYKYRKSSITPITKTEQKNGYV